MKTKRRLIKLKTNIVFSITILLTGIAASCFGQTTKSFPIMVGLQEDSINVLTDYLAFSGGRYGDTEIFWTSNFEFVSDEQAISVLCVKQITGFIEATKEDVLSILVNDMGFVKKGHRYTKKSPNGYYIATLVTIDLRKQYDIDLMYNIEIVERLH
jgi:hypothetical protein